MMFAKNRTRRLLYNDDADQKLISYDGYDYRITDEKSFLDARTTVTFGTQVDTYVWCLGNGCETPYGVMEKLNACLGSHEHATDLVVSACHAHGMEVWGSLRINDIHDSFMADCLEKTNDPLKAQHPEYLIGRPEDRTLPAELTERFLWTAFNFARPEVRDYRLSYIQKTASEHDFDGYELDFSRFIWSFPLGQERRLAPLMTDFVREARARLDAIARRRNRPYTLTVHVFDSPRLSLDLGLDVAAWLEANLIDVLVVGMGYLPYECRIDQWLDLAKPHGVPVYPSVNTNTFVPWWKKYLRRPETWQEAIRAAAAWSFAQGGDGFYLFNLFCLEDKKLGPLEKPFVFAPLREVGDAATLAVKNKLYAIQPAAESGFCHHASAATALPSPLTAMERKLPLRIGPDAEDPHARVGLLLRTTGPAANARLHLRLNHLLLAVAPADIEGLFRADVPGGVLRPGENELSAWCNAEADKTESPIILHQVFAEVKY